MIIMTRINLLEPSQLTSIHLMAEYRELPRVFTRVKWRMAKGQTLSDIQNKISDVYTLNTGHETFFNDKLAWLYARYEKIFLELTLKRAYNIDADRYHSIRKGAAELVGTEWWGYYDPSPEDVYLNMARVARRSNTPKVLAELESTL
jgi:hypothetical protein